jgi:hypothetical protein
MVGGEQKIVGEGRRDRLNDGQIPIKLALCCTIPDTFTARAARIQTDKVSGRAAMRPNRACFNFTSVLIESQILPRSLFVRICSRNRAHQLTILVPVLISISSA